MSQCPIRRKRAYEVLSDELKRLKTSGRSSEGVRHTPRTRSGKYYLQSCGSADGNLVLYGPKLIVSPKLPDTTSNSDSATAHGQRFFSRALVPVAK